MAGLLLGIVNQLQYFTDQGVVLSGGKIYTYTAGTTTPAATYTDSTLGTANANPIILNSAGRLTTEVWVPAGSSFKLVFKDSNDVQIGQTYDNVPALNDLTNASIYWAGTMTGTANSLILTVTSGPGSYQDGQTYIGVASATNTGPVTANINSIGSLAVRKNGGNPLTGGEIISGNYYQFTYKGGSLNLDCLAPLTASRLDVASATTVDLQTPGVDYVRLTGTTAITGITLRDGQSVECLVQTTGLTFTNGASLILYGANITAYAGDVLTFFGEPSGVTRLTKYSPASGIHGGLLRTNYYTTSGNFAKSADSSYIIVRMVGGGGGGGGATQTGTNSSAGAGGGAGGYQEKKYATSSLAASVAYVVGAAGAGGAAGVIGGNGGDSTFNASVTLTAGQGTGGNAVADGTAAVIGAAGVGGVSSGGDISVVGNNGFYSLMLNINMLVSGAGANSRYGSGGLGRIGTSTSLVGIDAMGYGAGGGGAVAVATSSNQAGGAGAPGLVIIEEYS